MVRSGAARSPTVTAVGNGRFELTAYELYLLLHLGGAVAWVGAAFVMTILGTRASLAGEPHRTTALVHDAEWLGLRLYLPANLVVLASGFLLVEEGDWGYGALWIKLGLAGLGVSFAIGAAFFGPGWKRAGAIAESESGDSAAVQAAVRRLLVGSWLDLGLLVAILFTMTVKPSGGEPGTLAVVAAIPVAFTALGVVLARAEARRPAETPLALEPR